MEELLTKLINDNKVRLKNMNQSALQSDNEYQMAYYDGISEEIENSIYDLENLLNIIKG